MPTRRGFLALVGLGVGAVAACTPEPVLAPPPTAAPQLDELLPHAELARRDAVAAVALAAAQPDRAAQLQVLAAERTAHADALDAEIARAAGTVDGTPVTATPTTPPATTAAPDLAVLRAGLQESVDSAAAASTSLPGYRAALLGSVAAACSVSLAVVV